MRAKIAVFVMLLIFAAAWSVEARAGGEVTVKINRARAVSKTKLTIQFVSLLEDSRCPAGAQCIQAGEARIKIQIKNGKGARRTFEIGTRANNQTVSFAGYAIRLVDVAPHPAANVRIDRSGYKATFEAVREK